MQVRHPPVINVLVWALQAPFFEILREMPFHVFVDEPLQVDIELAIGANDDIAEHTAIRWDIAALIV